MNNSFFRQKKFSLILIIFLSIWILSFIFIEKRYDTEWISAEIEQFKNVAWDYKNIPLAKDDILLIKNIAKLEEKNKNIENKKSDKKDIKSDEITLKQFRIKWISMEPLLKNGLVVEVFMNYYKKNNAKINEIVIHNYAWEKYPVIKKIRATSSDKAEIKWKDLYINDRLLTNSIWEKYIFSDNEIKMLSLYIKNNKIPDNSYFIFWELTKNSIDSRRFWAVWSVDFLWKLKE